MNIDQAMQTAVAKHQQGDLLEAARVYHDVLNEDASVADAWNLIGVIAHQMGKHSDAIETICRAIALRDDVAEYHLNLAATLMALGQAERAEATCLQALKIRPTYPEALNTLGNALAEQGRRIEALACFRRALKLVPEYADALCNMGQLFYTGGKLEEAEQVLQLALTIDPHLFQSHHNLGAVYQRWGRSNDAIRHYSEALKINPQAVEVLVNLGNTLRQQGDFEQASTCLHDAIQLKATYANAWNSLGVLHQDLANCEAALKCFEEAARLAPDAAHIASNLLFCLNLSSHADREHVFRMHVDWAARFAPESTVSQSCSTVLNVNHPLRIGYVSPDFRCHALAGFFEPILIRSNRKKFRVFCYAEVPCPDQTTVRFRDLADDWRSTCGLTDGQVATQIREDRIDILVDLAGHTANNRLSVFALKPAPVQVSLLGYLNTTGLSTVDYYVTDGIRDLPSEAKFYTEKVVHLPSGGCCWQAPKDAPDIGPLPIDRNGYPTFGSTHRLDKLNDDTLDLWAQILHLQPFAKILFFRDTFGSSRVTRGRIAQRLSQRGIEGERLRFEWKTKGSYLEIYNEIDVLLETVPWGSGTTTYESLWMGVPIPTLYGDRPFGRATASALTRVGVDNLVAGSSKDYANLVATLAGNPARLRQLRRDLRTMMRRSVCDASTFVAELERAYLHMWRHRCEGTPLQSLPTSPFPSKEHQPSGE